MGSPARRPAWAAMLLGLFVLLGAAYFARRPSDVSPAAPLPAAGGPRASAVPGSLAAPAPDAAPSVVASDSEGARARLRDAQLRLANYRAFAQYPPGSRPAAEHPDQLNPRAPVVRALPLVAGARADDEVHVQLGQDRRELVGDESARLWIRCEDSLGKPLPCVIEKAEVISDPGAGGALQGPFPVTFSDEGRDGDERAQDGTKTALVQPMALGLSRYHGMLRIQTSVRLGRDHGAPFFDLLYTGSPPARFTGHVRESIVDGSLQLALGVQVSRAGRYFVVGRVDDTQGKAVAYLEWSGELAIGEGSVPLDVFGKLIRDQRPTLPLFLRDVEGYLFFEDTTPDRAHMPRLAGVVHKTAVYSLSEFSSAEWDSEQKRRYLDEFEKDVRQASGEVGSATGAAQH